MARILWRILILFLDISVYLTKLNVLATEPQSSSSEINTGIDFNCPVYSSDINPTSVHRLTPGSIQVIASLGDSITAGVGTDWKNVKAEKRGLAFSIGAENSLENMTTIPSILKMYNRDLYGYSHGSATEESGFNIASGQAKSKDVITQVNILIDKLQTNSNINMEKDWKLITIYIGLNDLCSACYNVEKYSARNYVTNIARALQTLKDKVPRAYVNVIEMFDVSILRQLDVNDEYCQFMRPKTCPCIATEKNAEIVSRMSKLYQAQLMAEINSWKYDTETFTVVLHKNIVPSLSNGKPDVTLFSADCTHLNRKGHERTAAALWNNMFNSAGKTIANYETGIELVCPEKGAYLSTNQNIQIYDEINFKVKSKKNRHEKFMNHPYYAAILITVFLIMVAIVAAIFVCLACKDYSKQDQIKLYDLQYSFYDNEDYYIN